MTIKAFAIDFQNKAGERRTVIIEETAAEAECARIHGFGPCNRVGTPAPSPSSLRDLSILFSVARDPCQFIKP